MIIVSGATGTIGRQLVRLLAEAGRPVRGLSRRPPTDDDRRGIEWTRADRSDPAALREAMAGGEILFLLTANSADLVRFEKNAIRAAADAGVSSIVKLSALGASDHSRSLIGLWHHNVERELRGSGVPWTILRPHHFMQNFLDPLVFDRAAGCVHSASGDGVIPFVDTRDVAAVAARILMEPEPHAGETYALTGPEAVSYPDATARIGRVIGRTLTSVPESLDEAWQRRRAAGQPIWLVAAQLALAQEREGRGAEVLELVVYSFVRDRETQPGSPVPVEAVGRYVAHRLAGGGAGVTAAHGSTVHLSTPEALAEALPG